MPEPADAQLSRKAAVAQRGRNRAFAQVDGLQTGIVMCTQPDEIVGDEYEWGS
ncbi:MAG: hypothetical protein V3S26_07070 [Acidimicrobiia bacterium]